MYHTIQPFMQVNIPYDMDTTIANHQSLVKVSRFRKAKPIWKNRSFFSQKIYDIPLYWLFNNL